MKISHEEVAHVARLARLALTPEETQRYTAQLESILTYIAKLESLDTRDVPPTSHVLPLANVWREDVPDPRRFGDPRALVEAAPEREGPFFKVKKVIE